MSFITELLENLKKWRLSSSLRQPWQQSWSSLRPNLPLTTTNVVGPAAVVAIQRIPETDVAPFPAKAKPSAAVPRRKTKPPLLWKVNRNKNYKTIFNLKTYLVNEDYEVKFDKVILLFKKNFQIESSRKSVAKVFNILTLYAHHGFSSKFKLN